VGVGTQTPLAQVSLEVQQVFAPFGSPQQVSPTLQTSLLRFPQQICDEFLLFQYTTIIFLPAKTPPNGESIVSTATSLISLTTNSRLKSFKTILRCATTLNSRLTSAFLLCSTVRDRRADSSLTLLSSSAAGRAATCCAWSAASIHTIRVSAASFVLLAYIIIVISTTLLVWPSANAAACCISIEPAATYGVSLATDTTMVSLYIRRGKNDSGYLIACLGDGGIATHWRSKVGAKSIATIATIYR
jgi:hypothetical protein